MKPLKVKTLFEAFDSRNTLSSKQIEREKDEFNRARIPISAVKKGRGVRLNTLKGVDNTDAEDVKSLKDWAKMQKMNKEAGLTKMHGGDPVAGKREARKARRRVYNQVRSNTDDPSVIALNKDGSRDLIAGNTRASLRRVLGKPVKAHVFKR